MSQNNTVLGMLANVVLFSLVFQMAVYCLLLVFLSTPHTCAPVLSRSAWRSVAADQPPGLEGGPGRQASCGLVIFFGGTWGCSRDLIMPW